MRNKILLVLVLFLVSCGSSGTQQSDHNFKQGVAEVNVDFLPNAPPDKIYPDTQFKIIAELHNLAAYDITNAELSVINIDPSYFEVDPLQSFLDDMQGRSLTNPDGDKLFIEFDGIAGTLFENARQYLGNYLLKLRYSSTMEFSDTLCMNADLYQVFDSGCAVEQRKSYSGQGSPLAIAYMEEIISPGGAPEVEFRLLLRNRGKGKIKRVELQSARLGNDELDCHFSRSGLKGKKIEFTDKKQEVTILCNKKFLDNFKSYTTTIYLEFSYDYEATVKHRLVLINPDLSTGFI